MSFLRGNFRKKAVDIDFTAIGGGTANWIQGSNLNPDFRFGGFLMGSYASVSASAYIIISAQDAITSTYGTVGSNVYSVGYKFIPFIFQDISGGVTYHLSATGAMAGDDSVVAVATNSASAVYSGAVHLIFAGFIVSTPFAAH